MQRWSISTCNGRFHSETVRDVTFLQGVTLNRGKLTCGALCSGSPVALTMMARKTGDCVEDQMTIGQQVFRAATIVAVGVAISGCGTMQADPAQTTASSP